MLEKNVTAHFEDAFVTVSMLVTSLLVRVTNAVSDGKTEKKGKFD